MNKSKWWQVVLIYAGLALLGYLVHDWVPSLFHDSSGDNKAKVLQRYPVDDDHPLAYYDGFLDGIEYANENIRDLIQGTDAYSDIYQEGFWDGYQDGINGVEY